MTPHPITIVHHVRPAGVLYQTPDQYAIRLPRPTRRWEPRTDFSTSRVRRASRLSFDERAELLRRRMAGEVRPGPRRRG
jgi:hypothetical protein